MARLPIPGSDDGKWGQILNEYLSQSLDESGNLKPGLITKADVGLTNVDNTSDVDKPVSTAVQAALDTKASTAALAAKLDTTDLDTQTAANIGDGGSETGAAVSSRIIDEGSHHFRPFLSRQDFISWSSAFPSTHPDPTPITRSGHNAGTSVPSPEVIDLNTSDRIYTAPVVAIHKIATVSTIDHTGNSVSSEVRRAPSGGAGEMMTQTYEWITDSESMEIVYQATAGVTYRLWENERPHTFDVVQASDGGGGTYRLRIRPTSRQFRHWRLETRFMFAGQLVVSRTDTVFAPSQHRPRVLFVGDSYFAQGNDSGIAWFVKQLLGAEMVLDAIGGSGYLNSGGVTPGTYNLENGTFRGRLLRGLATNPTAMIIAGGINDDTSGLETELDTYFTAIRNVRPTMPVFALGPWSPSDTYRSSQAPKANLIKLAAESHNITYLDNISEPWITGTGSDTGPMGDGNADLMIGSDGVHPNGIPGRSYIGYRIANSINNSLPTPGDTP